MQILAPGKEAHDVELARRQVLRRVIRGREAQSQLGCDFKLDTSTCAGDDTHSFNQFIRFGPLNTTTRATLAKSSRPRWRIILSGARPEGCLGLFLVLQILDRLDQPLDDYGSIK